MSIDLDYIRLRDADQYGMECEDDRIGMILQDALTDRHVLLREVERLRAEVERERAAVVRFIRDQQEEAFKKDKDLNMDRMTKAIERGEHRREEEK